MDTKISSCLLWFSFVYLFVYIPSADAITDIILKINNQPWDNATTYSSTHGTTVWVGCSPVGTTAGLKLSCGNEQASGNGPFTSVALEQTMNGQKCMCSDEAEGIVTFVTLEIRYSITDIILKINNQPHENATTYRSTHGTTIYVGCSPNGTTGGLKLSCGGEQASGNGPYTSVALTKTVNGQKCMCSDETEGIVTFVTLEIKYDPVIEIENCQQNNTYIGEGESARCDCVVKEPGVPPVTVKWSDVTDSGSTSSVSISVTNNGTGTSKTHECLVSDNNTTWSTHDIFHVDFAYGPTSMDIRVTGGNVHSLCGSKLVLSAQCFTNDVVPGLQVPTNLSIVSTPPYDLAPFFSTPSSWNYSIEAQTGGDTIIECTVSNPIFNDVNMTKTVTITVNAPPTQVSMTMQKDGNTINLVPGTAMELNEDTVVEIRCQTVGGHPALSQIISLECGQSETTETATSEAKLNLTAKPDLENCVCSVQHVSYCGIITRAVNFTVTARITDIVMKIVNQPQVNATTYSSTEEATFFVVCYPNGWTNGITLSCLGQTASGPSPIKSGALTKTMNGQKCSCSDEAEGIVKFVTLEVRYDPVIEFENCQQNNTYIREGETARCDCVVKAQGVPPVTVKWSDVTDGGSNSSVSLSVTNNGTGTGVSHTCLVSENTTTGRPHDLDVFHVNFAYGPTVVTLSVIGGNVQNMCGPKLGITVDCSVDSVMPSLGNKTQLTILLDTTPTVLLSPVSFTSNSWRYIVETSSVGDVKIGCSVTNDVFADITTNATTTITVNAPPSISMTVTKNGITDEIAEGGALVVEENTEVEVKCENVGGNPSVDAISLECGQQTNTVTADTATSVTFTATPQLNSTSCMCTISSQCSPIVKQTDLLVKVEPSMNFTFNDRTRQSAVEVTEGDDVNFQCIVKANFQPSITMKRDASDVGIGAVTEIQPLHFNVNHITSAKVADDGLYTCSVTLSQGRTLTETIRLIVLYSPRGQVNSVPISNMDVENKMFSIIFPYLSNPPPTTVQLFRYSNPRSSIINRKRRNTEPNKNLVDPEIYTWMNGGSDGDREVIISMMNLDANNVKDYDAVIGNSIGENTFPFTINVTQLLETSSNPGYSTPVQSSNRDLIVMGVGGVVALVTLAFLIYAIVALILDCTAKRLKRKQRSSHQPSRVVMADMPYQGHSVYWQPTTGQVPRRMATHQRSKRDF